MKEISSHIFVECPNCQETGIVQEIGDINIDCEFFDIPTKKVSYSCYSCNHSKNNFKNDVYQDVWTKGYDYDLLEHKCSACGANDSIRLTKNSKIENHKTSLVCSGCKQERKYRVLISEKNWTKLGVDRYFGFQLKYQKSIKGNFFWILNENHLQFLKDYLSRPIRKQNTVHNNLENRIPKFIISAKNKNEILSFLNKVEKEIEGFVENK